MLFILTYNTETILLYDWLYYDMESCSVYSDRRKFTVFFIRSQLFVYVDGLWKSWIVVKVNAKNLLIFTNINLFDF